ncbi:hypothetical protein GCM10009087_25400 [Sphingomonas oligophenolica]
MRIGLLWTALIVGLQVILLCIATFAEFASVMLPFGGIPYSWNLLWLNLHWLIALFVGLTLTAASAYALVAERRRDSN